MASFEETMGRGRQRGSVNKLTAFRRSLMDFLPETRAQLAAAIGNGDMKAIGLVLESVLVPLRSDFPSAPVDLTQPPGKVAHDIKVLVTAGAIGVNHANALADLCMKLQRLESSQALLDTAVIEGSLLETATMVANAAAQVGDLATLETALTKALPYLQPRPEPRPPEVEYTVSAEPYSTEEMGMSEDERLAKWQAELDKYRN